MDAKELSKLLTWADDGTRKLYFAFAMTNGSGILELHRFHKGKAILHDLVQANEGQELGSRSYGSLTVSSAAGTVTFTASRSLKKAEHRALEQVLKQTKMKSLEIAWNVKESADSAV